MAVGAAVSGIKPRINHFSVSAVTRQRTSVHHVVRQTRSQEYKMKYAWDPLLSHALVESQILDCGEYI